MDTLVDVLQFTVIAAGLGWLFALLAMKRKTALHMVWGLFCGSLCLVMVKTSMADGLGDYGYLVGIGTCATCNVFWLVSRALFRTGQPFHARHLLLAGAVALPIAAGQFVELLSARGLLGEPVHSVVAGALGGWAGLLGSAVLLLAFWEGARDWRADLPAAERRLRLRFLATYAACVLACTLWTTPAAQPGSPLLQVGPLLEALSALAILVVAGHAVRFRTRHPLRPAVAEAAPERSADEDDLALAQHIDAYVRGHAPYLEAELKVADLAAALAVQEYRITRAITLGLQHANFNRYINGYRIEHAKRLLADPTLRSRSILAIGIDSGFGSIGPFNRAFKAVTGVTPSGFRSDALAPRPLASLPNGEAHALPFSRREHAGRAMDGPAMGARKVARSAG